MTRLISIALSGSLMIGGLTLAGCQSNDSTPSGQSNAYEGGNGAFGESPANPGEHSQERFRHATTDNPTTQPSTGNNQ